MDIKMNIHEVKSLLSELCINVFNFINDNNISTHHGCRHIVQVMLLCGKLFEDYQELTLFKKFIILAATLLHDIDDKKFFSTTDYENARTCIRSINSISSSTEESIIEIIKYTSTKNISLSSTETVLDHWKLIVSIADKLNAIGVEGVVRCYEFGRDKNRAIVTNETVRASTNDEIMSQVFEERYLAYTRGEQTNLQTYSTLDHYYDKLLHIKRIAYLWLNISEDKNDLSSSTNIFKYIDELHDDLLRFVSYVDSVRDKQNCELLVNEYIDQCKVQIGWNDTIKYSLSENPTLVLDLLNECLGIEDLVYSFQT